MVNRLKPLVISPSDPCVCGSEKQFGVCCINASEPPEVIDWFRKQKELHTARGRIKAAITAETETHRFVGVGAGDMLVIPKEKTFHEFLIEYSTHLLGKDWCNSELSKPFEQQHPVMQWRMAFNEVKHMPQGEIFGRKALVCSGPVSAYLNFSYFLYVLRHHILLQETLVRRLRIVDQFQGAHYELYVAAMFIRSGFDIEFEDEADGSTDHCEFKATYKADGKCFSVEAKSKVRQGLMGNPGNIPRTRVSFDLGRLLYRALKKSAKYERIIFLDANMPPENVEKIEDLSWGRVLSTTLSQAEKAQVNGMPAPPAYLFVTNHPKHWVGPTEPAPHKHIIATGFNMPEFKQGPEYFDPNKHKHYIKLFEDIMGFDEVPCEF